jgi:hypothetical protein
VPDRLKPSWNLIVTVLAFIIPLTVYAQSISSEPSAWDTAEMQTVPWILGIPHPTGFPAFVLIGWAWTHIVQVSSVAWRMNALSAACVSGACAAICSTAQRIGAKPLAAFACALSFGFGSVVWQHASATDVHDMLLLWLALAQMCIVAFIQSGRAGWMRAGCWFTGIGLATHPAAIWLLPALAFVWVTKRPRGMAISSVGIVAPLILYLYLPLRSIAVAAYGLDPAAHLEGVNSFLWDTHHTRYWSGFVQEVAGSQVGAIQAVLAVGSFANYPQFFAAWWPFAVESIGLVGLALAGVGAVALRQRPAVLIVLLLFGFAVIPFVAAFDEGDKARYIMLSFSTLLILAASASTIKQVAWVVAGLLAVNAMWLYSDHRGQHVTPDPGSRELIAAVASVNIPPGSIIIANWIDSTSLAYAQNVEGMFAGDIIVPWDSEGAKAKLPLWRKHGRIFLVYQAWAMGSVATAFPVKWIRVVPGAWEFQLYEICPN